MDRQTLFFDADDTLWENNVLFERTVDDFHDWLAHPTLDRRALGDLLTEIEAAEVVVHGYGSRVFLRCLGHVVTRLRRRPTTPAEEAEIAALAAALVEHRIELMPQVAETLTELGRRHDLRLLSKGDRDEQQAKLDASGLAHHFASAHLVPEKDDAVYAGLVADLALDVTTTWMVGNSPRSDILPARSAGMRAAYIPNENPWVLEQAELDPADAGVLRLSAFPQLTRHF